MTVMVTGGCGLGGSFAVCYALDQGEDVVASISRSRPSSWTT